MKQKIRILIPTILTATALVYCWTVLLINNFIPSWKHYVALGLFIIIILLAWKRIISLMISLGIYLLFASFHLISLSYNQSVFVFGSLDSQYNPRFQLLSLALFVLYFILNLDSLIEWDLDRKERIEKRKKA